MMKVAKLSVCSAVVGCLAACIFHLVQIEVHVERWHQRVESVEAIEDLNLNITRSQLYSDDVLQMAKQLAWQNRELVEREQKTIAYVVAVEDENNRLKNELTEATIILQDQIRENNDLHKQLENLTWRIEQMESTIMSLNEALRKVDEAQREQS